MREDTGIMREQRVRVFLPKRPQAKALPSPVHWIASEHWPPRHQELTFHLNAGELGRQRHSRPIHLVHRDTGIVGTTKPEWLDRLPLEQSHDDALSTAFDSAPRSAAVELTGEAELRLRIAADKPVAELFLRLNDLRPDGNSRRRSPGPLSTSRDATP